MESLYADSASAASSPRSVGPAKASSVSEEPLSVRWDYSSFSRVKLMCSFGGRIIPRPHDNQLRYVGGETRIVVVSRNITCPELSAKLCRLFGASVTIKYQLPSEDLDALISVTSDEDLDNMMEEYDRLQLAANRSTARLRLFLFPRKLEKSLSDLLDTNQNRDYWFVDALNGMPVLPRMRSETSSILSEAPDYLFGLDLPPDESAAGAPSYSHFAEQPTLSPESASVALSAALLQGSGEISSAPGSPLERMLTRVSASSAPPAMSTMLSAVAVAALKGRQMKQGALSQVVDNSTAEDSHSPIQEQASEKNAYGEHGLRPIITGTAVKQDRPSDDPIMLKPQVKGSSDQVVQQESGSSTARPGPQQRPAVQALDDPQRESSTVPPAKSNAANQDPIPRPMGRMVHQDENQKPAAICTKKAMEAKEMQGISRKANSDNRGGDAWNQVDSGELNEQRNFESRPMDPAIRAVASKYPASTGGAEAALQAPNPSKLSRLIAPQVSSYTTTKVQAAAPADEAVQPLRTSSPTPPSYSFLPPALSQQMTTKPQVPILATGPNGDVLRPAFYQVQPLQPSSGEETAPTYATQAPAIQRPILTPLAAPPASTVPPPQTAPKPDTAPAFARISPVSGSPSPPVAHLSPPQQLLGLPTAGSPPLTNVPAPAPVIVYSFTNAAGVPVNSPLLQLQRQVSDPVPQSQRVAPILNRDLHATTAHVPSPTAALPPRFRGQPVFYNQQAQPVPFDKRPPGQRQAAPVPPYYRSPLQAPTQYSYYNMDQLSAYPPSAGVQGATIYEPPMYTIDPNNFGGVPSEAALQFAAGGNPFMEDLHSTPSDVSGFVHSYQDVLDVSADQQQAPGVATAGDNRIQGRHL